MKHLLIPLLAFLTLPNSLYSSHLHNQKELIITSKSSKESIEFAKFLSENGVVKLVVRDKRNDTSNEYSIVVGETDKKFVFNFKVENIKVIPGSDILGVPASEIIEIIKPLFNKFKILETFFFSLNLWLEINFELISYFFNKIFETLVSSHKI